MSKRLYPPVRPQSVSEVLDAAFHIFAAALPRTLPYGILLILAGQLPNIYSLSAGRPLAPLPHDARSAAAYVASFILVLTLWPAMLLRERAIAQGEPTSVRVELARAVRSLPALVPLAICTAAAVAAGIVLLVAPGVYLLIAFSMALPALVLESKRPIEAMKFSWRLVRGHWWRTLAIFLVTMVIAVAFDFLVAVLAAAAVQFIHGADVALTTAATRVLIIALGAFFAPYGAATLLALYGDLMMRHALAAGAAEP